MPKQEIDDTMRKVKDWLTEEGIYRDKVPDDNANYLFVGEYPPGRGVSIIQPKQREDLIIVSSTTELAKEHLDGLKAKPEKDRKDIIWDMQFKMLFLDTDFNIIPSIEDPQKFVFTRPIHFDGLTKNLLIDAIRENFKCHLFIVWTMMKYLGEAPPKSPETMYS